MKPQRLHRLERWLIIWKAAYFLAWFSCMSFGLITVLVLKGCDAWHGKVQAGHYYLGDGKSGHFFIEVSQAIFYYSKWHMALAFIMWPIGFLAGTLAMKLINKRIATLKETGNTH